MFSNFGIGSGGEAHRRVGVLLLLREHFELSSPRLLVFDYKTVSNIGLDLGFLMTGSDLCNPLNRKHKRLLYVL